MVNFRTYFFGIYYLINVVFAHDILSVIITLPIMLLIVYDLRHNKGEYISPREVAAFIVFLYFVIEPLQQIDHGYLSSLGPVSSIRYSNLMITVAALVVTAFYLTYIVSLDYFLKGQKPAEFVEISPNKAVLVCLLGIAGAIIYVIVAGGFSNVFAARNEKVATDLAIITPLPLGLLTVSTTVLVSMCHRSLSKALGPTVVCLLILLILVNPFNSARFGLIGCLLPVAFAVIQGRVRTSLFYLTSIFGVVVVMPILSLTSRFGSLQNAYDKHGYDPRTTLLNLQFIDSFDMLVECIRYTRDFGYTWGAKILGNLLFYVPRSIWTSKPTLNGFDVGGRLFNDKVAGTDNLSMFIGADGYRDFGLFGAALCGLIASWLVYLLLYRHSKIVNGVHLMGFYFIAAMPIVIRGPFQAVIPLFFYCFLWISVLTRLLSVPVRWQTSLRRPVQSRDVADHGLVAGDPTFADSRG